MIAVKDYVLLVNLNTGMLGKRLATQRHFRKTLYTYVFLNERKSIFEFRAEEADTEDTLSPVGWKDRFGELIWKMHS